MRGVVALVVLSMVVMLLLAACDTGQTPSDVPTAISGVGSNAVPQSVARDLRTTLDRFWDAFLANDPTAAGWYASSQYIASLDSSVSDGLLMYGRMKEAALLGVRKK
ncbi:MAG: hypothetical protein HY678_05995 [Chloroflexi bacterium]|nr:hypothetical protein [Chloroflexota bacterium]